MKYMYKVLPVMLFFVVMAAPLYAQNCNPNIPIDGGLSALLAAGAGYGVKKLYDKKEARKEG